VEVCDGEVNIMGKRRRTSIFGFDDMFVGVVNDEDYPILGAVRNRIRGHANRVDEIISDTPLLDKVFSVDMPALKKKKK
jgi:formylmethanofuran dehydrogenase subunit B